MSRDSMQFWRQNDIVSIDKLSKLRVAIVGSGSVGSFTALTLAKMGVDNITVFDSDTVEDHNLPNQFFMHSQVGMSKVDALKDLVFQFTGVSIDTVNENVTADNVSLLEEKDVVVFAVDKMDVRIELYNAMKKNVMMDFLPLLIDSRMGAEVIRLYSVIGNTPREWYEKTLYTSENALQEPCSAKTIIYTVNVIAGLIANIVKMFVQDEEIKQEIVMDVKNLEFV